ncbi:hypothetical protein CC78DRAFT_531670 [Lojkania enalia]|uniref:Integral membrane protein n=1 Tax=Lojkania enalia TaxID=147567 RepID=A0A9P4KE93_9PLEO|nr:hypothetical protein CC78DRAFT_531670 [Didymosphaeria enalia]
MRRLLPILMVAASVVAEGVVDYSKLPDCAQQCTVFKDAEANCVPPRALTTDQSTYQSCFCSSALILDLHSSGAPCQSTPQQTICSAEDATKISQYYIGLCNGPVVAPPEASTTTAAETTGTATTTAATGTSTVGAAGVGQGANAGQTDKKESWWSGHWQWILMVIIIAIAIVFFWVGGVWLRRRHDRKKDAARANVGACDPPPGGMVMSGGRDGSLNTNSVGNGLLRSPPPLSVPSQSVAGLPPRQRSRTNTLQSFRGHGNSSRTSLAQPVVWGPHQHQAFAHGNSNGSPGPSVPPSPTLGITPPNPIMRNHEAMRSEPRFNNPGVYSSAHRPHTALDGAIQGNEGPNIREGSVRVLNSVRSDPTLSPHIEGQTAEFGEVTPQKHKKLHRGG